VWGWLGGYRRGGRKRLGRVRRTTFERPEQRLTTRELDEATARPGGARYDQQATRDERGE
jgi:hypothetical protein